MTITVLYPDTCIFIHSIHSQKFPYTDSCGNLVPFTDIYGGSDIYDIIMSVVPQATTSSDKT